MFKQQHEATCGVLYVSLGNVVPSLGLPCGVGSIGKAGHEELPGAGLFGAQHDIFAVNIVFSIHLLKNFLEGS